MSNIDKVPALLVVVPDRTTPGSQGRLCLQLPKEFKFAVGRRYSCLGHLSKDGAVMLVANGHGNHTVTPRRQLWWKNGVYEHGLLVNWHAAVFILDVNLLVVMLDRPVSCTLPASTKPSSQPALFGE